jgi:hypothetical protein
MGWNTGADLMADIIELIEEHGGTVHRTALYTELIKLFEDPYDCDVMDECLGQSPDFDAAYRLVHPEE